MNPELRQIIDEHISDGEARREACDWGGAKVEYLKGLDLLESEIRDHRLDPADPSVRSLQTAITGKLTLVDRELAKVHREQGVAALGNRDYSLAMDELETAIALADENDQAFLEECKVHLDKARRKHQDHTIYEEITPIVQRGDDLMEMGDYAEAVLEFAEVKKQLQNFPRDHRYVLYVDERLQEARRELVKPLLRKAHRARTAGKEKRALDLIKRAQLLLGDDDRVVGAFLETLRLEAVARIGGSDEEADDVEESPEIWQAAIRDYEEALSLFTSFTASDPLLPVYVGSNVYENRYLESRRKLARLYGERARRLHAAGKVARAIKNYKEALKLYPRGDRDAHRIISEIKKLKLEFPAQTS